MQHGYLGAEILRNEGINEKYAKVCERHVGIGLTIHDIKKNGFDLPLRNIVPQSIEEKIICYADKFFSKAHDLDKELDISIIINEMKKINKLNEFYKLEKEIKEKFA